MVMVTLLGGNKILTAENKVGIGFSKYNPEDAERFITNDQGTRVYDVQTVESICKSGKVKRSSVKIAIRKKPWIYDSQLGYEIALARAVKDLQKQEGYITVKRFRKTAEALPKVHKAPKPAKSAKAASVKPSTKQVLDTVAKKSNRMTKAQAKAILQEAAGKVGRPSQKILEARQLLNIAK
jgi:hypothetical protein